jgi:fatty-acyl-CoA synthase
MDTVTDQSETLGTPLPHAEVKIVDLGSGEIQPIGVPGEICVRGYQSMHGYFGMEAETKATIKADGWQHTGDLGTLDSRGYLRFAGRLREMIVRGGMNLYPREIEDVLFEHPGVSQVSVVGVADERLGEIVVAVIVRSSQTPTVLADDLYRYCKPRLAAHKIPAKWFFVSEFPLTPSGKIQKFKLVEEINTGAILPADWNRPIVSAA